MEANVKKDRIQARAVELLKSFQHIVLEWATGCGKTLASLKMVQQIQDENPMSKGLLVFKESTHRKNWIADIEKHNMTHILERVELILYASLHKTKCQYYDYIVLDECHALTWKRLECLRQIIVPTTRLILLSATIPSDKKYLVEKLVQKQSIKYATIGLHKAIQMGLVPAPKIFVHKVQMIGTEQKKHDSLHRKLKYFQKENMFSLIKTTGLKKKKSVIESKTIKANEIIKSFMAKGRRFICFAGSIEQANDIPGPLISSKSRDEYNQSTIDLFNDGGICSLMAVKMIREAVNLTNIECGLIVQLDKEPLAFYQMLGRCLRSENPEMHMILCENSVDQEYFNNVMDETLLKYVIYV